MDMTLVIHEQDIYQDVPEIYSIKETLLSIKTFKTYFHNNIDQQFSAIQHHRVYAAPDEHLAYWVMYSDNSINKTTKNNDFN